MQTRHELYHPLWGLGKSNAMFSIKISTLRVFLINAHSDATYSIDSPGFSLLPICYSLFQFTLTGFNTKELSSQKLINMSPLSGVLGGLGILHFYNNAIPSGFFRLY